MILALLLCASFGEAQLRSFDCAPDTELSQAEGRSVIDRVQEQYNNISSFRSQFHQHSYLAAMDIGELSTGTVWFSKPGRMKWEYQTPEEQVFLVRDETLWLYQKEDRQLIINNFVDVLLTDLPVAFIMGLGDLRRDFSLKKACRNQEGLVIELTAKEGGDAAGSKHEGLEGFKLLVREGAPVPAGAQVIHLGGNLTSILLTEIRANPEITERFFAPNFPSGIDINDMRNTPR